MLDNLLIGLLLGCSQLLLGLGLRKQALGIIGLVLETAVSYLSATAAFVLFPFFVLLLMTVGGSGNKANRPTKCFRIVGCSGPLAGKEYELSAQSPSLEFGVESNEVRFPKGTPGVSRHHCRVTLRNENAYLTDLDSRYGTFLRIPPQRLQPQREYELHDKTEFCLASNAVVFRVYDDTAKT